MATKAEASAIWRKMLADDNLFGDGRRNDDAVNLCCVCKVLGKDPMDGYHEQHDHHCENGDNVAIVNYNFKLGMRHVDRVIPYSNTWFSLSGNDIIEDYGIQSASYM